MLLKNSINKGQSDLIPRFIFKIFRKNTRFKNSNQSYTLFIRKLVILRQRRLGWKPYMSTSSAWTNYSLKYKNMINFYQTQSMYNYTIDYSHLNMVLKTQQPSTIGFGKLPLNYNFTKTLPQYFVKNTLYGCQSSKNSKTTKLILQAQFNKLSSFKKLNALGFNFSNLIFSKMKLPHPDELPNTALKLSLQTLTLGALISLKTLHTHLTLFYINIIS